MTSQHPVVSRADEFGERQHLQFKPHAEHATAEAERGETPVRRDDASAKSSHRAAEQPRVFRFLREPQIHDLPHLVCTVAEIFPVKGDE